jgi:hypothetical protein
VRGQIRSDFSNRSNQGYTAIGIAKLFEPLTRGLRLKDSGDLGFHRCLLFAFRVLQRR